MALFVILIFIVMHTVQVSGLANYLVYPVNNKNEVACAELSLRLKRTLGESRVQTVGNAYLAKTYCWIVTSTLAEISDIREWASERTSTRLVSTIVEDYNAFTSAGVTYGNTSTNTQEDRPTTEGNQTITSNVLHATIDRSAPRDLSIVSWPRSRNFPIWPRRPKGYKYDPRYIQDTYIYLIDNGIDPRHPEFRHHVGPLEWEVAPLITNRALSDDSPNYHGSCVASKAVGTTNGVSKSSQLVVIKARVNIADATWALSRAPEHILDHGRQGKSIIVLPWTSQSPAPADGRKRGDEWETIIDIFRDIMGKEVLMVVPAGNHRKRSQFIDTFPGKFWYDLGDFRNGLFVIAGAVATGSWIERAGSLASFSQLGESLAAPGASIRCAGPKGQQYADGTSFSTAMAAGLAAYWLGQGVPISRVLDKMKDDSRFIAPNT